VLGLDDAGIAAASPVGGDIETSDLTTLVKIGQDELDDSAAATMQMLTEVLGDAVGEAEDAAIASGSGSGQPRGLALSPATSARSRAARNDRRGEQYAGARRRARAAVEAAGPLPQPCGVADASDRRGQDRRDHLRVRCAVVAERRQPRPEDGRRAVRLARLHRARFAGPPRPRAPPMRPSCSPT
jgi:hypothetical protein